VNTVAFSAEHVVPIPAHIIRANRALLASVPRWLEREVWAAGVAHYGMPEGAWEWMDLPIDDTPCIADLLCALLYHHPGNYLEIGVSAGKCFAQVQRYAVPMDAHCVGIDVEALNPVLEQLLAGTPYTYVHGSAYEAATWDRVPGPFSVIYSDALHEAGALLEEYRQLERCRLFDPAGFAYVFDDLGGGPNPMVGAVQEVAARLEGAGWHCRLHFEACNGWVGQHEPPHGVGTILGHR